jgi:hypothetical protein
MGVRHVRIVEKAAIAASWAVMTAAGCAGIAIAPLTRPGSFTPLTGAVLFSVVMTCVHVIGYELYKQQADGGSLPSASVAGGYWSAIKVAVLEQGIVAILAVLMLDGGLCAHMALVSVADYWPAVCLIIVRRPDSPTTGDLAFMKYGFFVILVIVFTAGPMYWATLDRW